MGINTVYLIWPDGESPDKAFSFTDVVAFDKAREMLDEAGVSYGHAVVPLLGNDIELDNIRMWAINQGEQV